MHDSLYWLIGLAAVAILLIVIFRRGGVRIGAKGFGTEVSLEGKGAPDKAPEPAPASGQTHVRATGAGSVAAGRDIRGPVVTGDRNRVRNRGG